MKTENKKSRKWWLPVSALVLITLSIIIVLAGNKKKIDEAQKPIDRTTVKVAVSVASATISPLDVNLQYPALIQPSDEAMLYSQASGIISSLNISLGKQVKKGQVLGKLDTRILEINLRNAEIAQKAASINQAKLLDDYNRARDLYENKAGLEVNMLTAKNNYENAVNNYDNSLVQIKLIKQQIANANIIAPLSGTVSVHKVKQGEFVNPGTPIAVINDISKIKATLFVDQQMSYKLQTGKEAIISSPLFADKTFTGKIIFISPVADVNHNYQIDLLIPQSSEMPLRGGTDVQVIFNTISQKDALQIPKSAILNDAKKPYVFVAENGKARMKSIRTGQIQGDKAEVLEGLHASEQVITSGQINLRDGSIINILK